MLATYEGTNNTGEYVSFVSDVHPRTEVCAQENVSGEWHIYYVSSRRLFHIAYMGKDKNIAVDRAKEIAENVLFLDNPRDKIDFYKFYN